MRILQVNKYHHNKGGADKYYLNLSKLLEERGHDLAYFSMQHPDNIESNWSKYFVSNIEFNNGNLFDKFKSPFRIFYSQEAKRKFEKLIIDFKPEIIHLHNIYHQISPSILHVSKKYKIPTIIHLHDYKLICPNYQLFVNNNVCEDCKVYKYYNCFIKKCHKNSYSKSALVAFEMYFHHRLLNIYRKNIDYLISPSNFLRNKFIDFAWDENKITTIYNPFDSNLIKNSKIKSEDYLLYFGRLSREKGIDIIIKALKNTKILLNIVGKGEYENELKNLASKLNVRVNFLGYKEKQELSEIIQKAKAVIIPSIWYENMPLNMLEALSLEKIVIASNIGGMPEIIKDKQNSFLFEPGSVNSLKETILNLNNYNLKEIEKKAGLSVLNLSPANNIDQVLSVYKRFINK